MALTDKKSWEKKIFMIKIIELLCTLQIRDTSLVKKERDCVVICLSGLIWVKLKCGDNVDVIIYSDVK